MLGEQVAKVIKAAVVEVVGGAGGAAEKFAGFGEADVAPKPQDDRLPRTLVELPQSCGDFRIGRSGSRRRLTCKGFSLLTSTISAQPIECRGSHCGEQPRPRMLRHRLTLAQTSGELDESFLRRVVRIAGED